MSKQEHTPGPWECRSGAVIKPDHTYDGIPLADMDREPGNGTAPVERDANARLMAASPDMLSALEEYVAEWDLEHAHEDHRVGYTQETNALIWARQAIAKATT